jgi:raffinose/stachyose/melibiose transport system substrate-binding protein
MSITRRGTLKLAAALAGTAALPVAACSSKPDSGTSGGQFTYWSMWKEGEPQQKVLAGAIAQFTKDAGIKVDVQWVGRDVVKSKLPPALNTTRIPDLVDQASDQLKPLMGTQKQGRGLAGVYAAEIPGESGKKVGDVLPAKYIDSLGLKLADGQPFMVPYSLSGVGLFYDASLVTAVAGNPLSTWDAFVSTLDTIKASGTMAPLTADADQGWADQYWMTYLLNRELGPGSLQKIAADETGQAWLQPAVATSAQKIEKLAKGGYFLKGYDASKSPEQQKNWAQGKAGFLLMGSWLPVETQPYARQGMTYASLPFPSTGSAARSEEVALFGFAIPAKASNAASAEKFIAYFMNKDRVGKMASEAVTICARPDVEAPAALAAIKKQIDSVPAVHGFTDGVEFSGWGDKVYFPAVADLLVGKTTAAQFADTLAKAQADYWKNN